MSLKAQHLRNRLEPFDAVLARTGKISDILAQLIRYNAISKAEFDKVQQTSRGKNVTETRNVRWPEETPCNSTNPFNNLPSSILDHVLSLLQSKENVIDSAKNLLLLSLTDRFFKQTIDEKIFVPHAASWTSAAKQRPNAASDARNSTCQHPYVLNRLAGATGCMKCPTAPLTRKVYWQYNMRVCRDCLIRYTIAEQSVVHDYNLTEDDLKDVGRRIVNIYRPGYLSFDCAFFWYDDITKLVTKKYNVSSLDEYLQQKRERQLQKLRDIEAKAQEWTRLMNAKYPTMIQNLAEDLREYAPDNWTVDRRTTDILPEEQERLERECKRRKSEYDRRIRLINAKTKKGDRWLIGVITKLQGVESRVRCPWCTINLKGARWPDHLRENHEREWDRLNSQRSQGRISVLLLVHGGKVYLGMTSI
jgi:hypothetical protein